MAEYIDRAAFVKDKREWYCAACAKRQGMKRGRLQFVYEIGDAPCRACSVDDMIDDVEYYPAADVAPVVHAHWIKEYTLGWYDGEQNYKLICPACNYSYLDNHLGAIAPKHFNYCPNCGAKMDEEVDE